MAGYINKGETIKKVSYNLRRIMEDNRYSLHDISKITGLSRTTIWRYISGERLPSVDNLIILADALGCKYEDILD